MAFQGAKNDLLGLQYGTDALLTLLEGEKTWLKISKSERQVSVQSARIGAIAERGDYWCAIRGP
jgi:hypothetical protein